MTTEQVPSMRIGAVVGQTLRALRDERGQTQQDAAHLLARWGLIWSRAQVAAIEAGRRESFTLEELIIMCNVYRVDLSEWFPGTGGIVLNDYAEITREELRGTFPVTNHPYLRSQAYYPLTSETDRKAARLLGISGSALNSLAVELWGARFRTERERRLSRREAIGDRRRIAGLRSAISRKLMSEMRDFMQNKIDDDDEP